MKPLHLLSDARRPIEAPTPIITVGIEVSSLGLDSMPRINHWLGKNPQAVAAHSLIEAQQSSGIIVRDLILSADQEADPYLDGNVGGAIFLHDCEDVVLQRVTINSFNGDAISWQVSHDVRVEGCTICGVKDLGLHPGSGSQRPVMRDNTVSDCEDGNLLVLGSAGRRGREQPGDALSPPRNQHGAPGHGQHHKEQSNFGVWRGRGLFPNRAQPRAHLPPGPREGK